MCIISVIFNIITVHVMYKGILDYYNYNNIDRKTIGSSVSV